MERLDFINQRLPQKNKAKAYAINVDEAMVEYYWVYAKQINPSYHIFIIHQNFRRLVNYHLLQWVQACQHNLFTSTLNK